ncbi:small-conductance mechanosensitive channel [Faecalicoccus acidiformans]|uniref:ATP synthase subunit I n=1 Tax=Faecalicoccus acidiformans TaxID=915173 RepID=A0A7W8D0S1_9FIRM|nr:ATP synthase subunit I [Faecalicoccus acidiformans]MBB5185112.1 small-conductance mechanosensitive channel [Faecalicoccus acidiformans]MBM6830571.1 ATP synthase subunit I [Faecalicoccus acidiformans]
MNELNGMNKKILNYSLGIVAIACIVSFILFKDWKVVLGLLAGLAIALLGYRMIIAMTLSLRPDEKSGQKQGSLGYVVRYLFYICTFVLLVVLGIPVLALLVGFLCHKAAILLYVVLNREVDDND